MSQNDKIVVFDFCETLVNFQTANEFVRFVGIKECPLRFHIFNFIFKLFGKLRIWSILNKVLGQPRTDKKFYLRILKGISKIKIDKYGERFCLERIEPHYIPETYSILLSHIYSGDIVVISSGGYDSYLKFFCKKHNIKYLNCSKINFENDQCSGSIMGEDCMDNQKVVELQRLFPKKIIDKFYTDSISDLPLIKYSKEVIVVSKRKHQFWLDNIEYCNIKELIWI